MSVEVILQSIITTNEILETNVPAASFQHIVHDGYNVSQSLAGGTSPPATKCVYLLQSLAAGAGTINLMAMTGTNGAMVNGAPLKVRCLRVKNLGANALTIGEGAVSGYELLGNAWAVILAQNQHVTFYLADAAPVISAAAKNIDLAGTGEQTSEWTIILG